MQENYQIEISQSNLLAITGLVLLLIIKLHCSCSRQECIQFVKISAKLDPCCKKKMIIPGSLYPKSDVSVLLLLRISYCSVDKSAYVQIAIIRMEEAFEAVEFISLLSQAMHTLRLPLSAGSWCVLWLNTSIMLGQDANVHLLSTSCFLQEGS